MAMSRRTSITLTLREFVQRNILECPICFETMRSQIYSCENGHAVCEGCRNRLRRCSFCRAPHNNRCRLLETLSDRLHEFPATPGRQMAAANLREISEILGLTPRTLNVALIAAAEDDGALPFAPAPAPAPTVPLPRESASDASGRCFLNRFSCFLCLEYEAKLPDLIAHVKREHGPSILSFGLATLNFNRSIQEYLPIIENNNLFWFYKSQCVGECPFRALKMAARKHIARKYIFCMEVSRNNFGEKLRYEDNVYSEHENISIRNTGTNYFQKIVELSKRNNGRISCRISLAERPN